MVLRVGCGVRMVTLGAIPTVNSPQWTERIDGHHQRATAAVTVDPDQLIVCHGAGKSKIATDEISVQFAGGGCQELQNLQRRRSWDMGLIIASLPP